MRYRLLALDLDGTLLDPAGELPEAAREAVAEARRAGLEIVLCTGRRYRTTRPVLRTLGLEGSVVVNNGALVKDAATGRTLHRNFVSAELYPDALEIMRGAGTPLIYVDGYHEDTDILTEAEGETHPFQRDYLDDHGEHCRFVADLGKARRDDVIMLSMMADEATLLPLRERAHGELGSRVSTHLIINKNYRGMILEFFSPSSGKWSALARVAAEAGIAPEDIAAIGDDANDAELLRCAGLGIAMGNAVEIAKQAADLVVRGNEEAGVIEAIERILLER